MVLQCVILTKFSFVDAAEFLEHRLHFISRVEQPAGITKKESLTMQPEKTFSKMVNKEAFVCNVHNKQHLI